MIHLYHVAVGHTELQRLFTPRVPFSTGDNEDKSIPRICFADSIDHCITAIAEPFYTTYDLKPITIYAGDFDESKLIPPEILYDKGLVQDALLTREYWYQESITLTGRHAYLRGFESDNYFIPVETIEKRTQVLMYITQHAKEFTSEDMHILPTLRLHDILTYVVPHNWKRWEIEVDDIANEVGFTNMRVAYNAEILYE